MKNAHNAFTRSSLESLSTGELLNMAEEAGIDIPYGLERIFIIEELLLEQSNADNGETDDNTEDMVIIPSYTEPVALPKQYNISFIEVMIRDPLWVYVYWEIKNHDRELHEHAGDFNGYFLRVYPFKEGETSHSSKENSFTVSIDANDPGRYVGFAEHESQESLCYIIKLIVLRGSNEQQIAVSHPFKLPALISNNTLSENMPANTAGINPLIRLSGVFDYTITKSSDRSLKTKG